MCVNQSNAVCDFSALFWQVALAFVQSFLLRVDPAVVSERRVDKVETVYTIDGRYDPFFQKVKTKRDGMRVVRWDGV